MATNIQHITEVLKAAIKGEEDGYRFYDLLSKKAQNKAARIKLENLRDDEIRHRETLIDIFHKHVGPEIGELPPKGINALAEVFRKGHLEERKSEMQFIDLAIEAELAATRYYQTERDLIPDPEFKRIFDQLAEEEHSHYELLQAEREAITGSYHWFSYDAGAPLED